MHLCVLVYAQEIKVCNTRLFTNINLTIELACPKRVRATEMEEMSRNVGDGVGGEGVARLKCKVKAIIPWYMS